MGQRNQAIHVKNTKLVTAAITRPANTTAYAAGDAVSNVTTDAMFIFDNVPGRGEVEGGIITSSGTGGATKLDGELWLFTTEPAETVDNAAATFTAAEILTCVGVLKFPTANHNANAVTSINQAFGDDEWIPYRANNDGTNYKLYGQLVSRNASTPSSSEVLTITLSIRSNY